jgi:hypothetical protein
MRGFLLGHSDSLFKIPSTQQRLFRLVCAKIVKIEVTVFRFCSICLEIFDCGLLAWLAALMTCSQLFLFDGYGLQQMLLVHCFGSFLSNSIDSLIADGLELALELNLPLHHVVLLLPVPQHLNLLVGTPLTASMDFISSIRSCFGINLL